MKATASAVRDLLAKVGPLTAMEVAKFFPESRYQDVSSILSNMRKRLATKRVYICEWTHDGVGKFYLRPVYALGAKRDAKKPECLSPAQRCKRWREKQRVPKVNSIWTWAAQA